MTKSYVSQVMPTKFNRGMLMNIEFIEANKLGDFDCAIFHDVDLYSENDKHMYKCSENPTHMSAAVDKFNYKYGYFLWIKSMILRTCV